MERIAYNSYLDREGCGQILTNFVSLFAQGAFTQLFKLEKTNYLTFVRKNKLENNLQLRPCPNHFAHDHYEVVDRS